MNFPSDAIAKIEGLLNVNRDFCKQQMAGKASVRCAAESIRDFPTLLYLFSADFAMDFCKKNALPRHVLHAQQGFLCCFLHNLADFMTYRHS